MREAECHLAIPTLSALDCWRHPNEATVRVGHEATLEFGDLFAHPHVKGLRAELTNKGLGALFAIQACNFLDEFRFARGLQSPEEMVVAVGALCHRKGSRRNTYVLSTHASIRAMIIAML